MDHGVPETISLTPRVDRIDFYFLRDYLHHSIKLFPIVHENKDESLIYPPTNSSGTERTEGKRVRILYPICRFFPIDKVRLMVNKQPEFEAVAQKAYLHLDIKTGPKNDIW